MSRARSVASEAFWRSARTDGVGRQACTDADLLDSWLERFDTAATLDDVGIGK
jgi:hypothetical protein